MNPLEITFMNETLIRKKPKPPSGGDVAGCFEETWCLITIVIIGVIGVVAIIACIYCHWDDDEDDEDEDDEDYDT